MRAWPRAGDGKREKRREKEGKGGKRSEKEKKKEEKKKQRKKEEVVEMQPPEAPNFFPPSCQNNEKLGRINELPSYKLAPLAHPLVTSVFGELLTGTGREFLVIGSSGLHATEGRGLNLQ
jgi:hypothetical protein